MFGREISLLTTKGTVLPRRPFVKYVVTCLLLVMFAVVITWSCGYTYKNAAGNSLIMVLTLILSRKNRCSALIAFCFLLLCAIYAPIGIVYGKINDGFIASALQTNIGEASEFLQLIQVKHLLLSGGILIFAVWFLRGSHRGNQHKFVLLLLILVLINAWPRRMVSNLVNYTVNTLREMKHYDVLSRTQYNDWNVLPGVYKYQTIVVIIGESVRRDYLSVYGYPLPTTPWLNTAAGLFINGYVSSAANTIASLTRTLVLDYEKSNNLGNNVVTLAKEAGFHTWWISNQGSIGEYDTPLSVIGHAANDTIFLKDGGYTSRNIDDEALLPDVKSAIQTPGQKVIFVHMMGSHPNTCDRLFTAPNDYKQRFSPQVACYLASINKTDKFLNAINEQLKLQGQSFAMIYFSDHGLSVDNDDNTVHHALDVRNSYEIPLIITASDITRHRLINNTLSARNFLGIFTWLTGIRSSRVPPLDPQKNIQRSGVNVFNGEHSVEFNHLRVQQPVIPRL